MISSIRWWRPALALASLALAAGVVACSKKSTSPTDPNPTPNPTPPPGTTIGLRLVKNGLDQPVFMTGSPGDTSRLFVLEKGGDVRVIKSNVLLSTPFLSVPVATAGEMGLAGMAFDPGYATNGRFYLSFLDPNGDSRLVRYTVSLNRDIANPSGQNILTVTQPNEDNHKAGMIAFGPDGYLYMSIGDGGGQEDPSNNGQSTDDLLGAVLRLDVSGSGTGYGFPPDNPLFPPAPGLRELWSIGLRNPWRFSFDRSNGDLYLTDVGQYAHEEINVNTNASGRGKGANYGWRITEGNDCFNPPSGCNRTGLTAPVLAYDHVGPDCAVIGGYVYRGADIPSLQGTYFYGDHCAGWIKSFKLSGGFASQLTDWPNLDPNGNISSFGQDSRGELYVMTMGGSLYKIVAQ